jgi:hypothetical protein
MTIKRELLWPWGINTAAGIQKAFKPQIAGGCKCKRTIGTCFVVQRRKGCVYRNPKVVGMSVTCVLVVALKIHFPGAARFKCGVEAQQGGAGHKLTSVKK